MWSLLCFITGTATLLLVNGQLQSLVPFQEQSKQCRKSLSKLDSEIFNKAINAYVADPKKNLANLSKCAKDMGVYTKLMNVMEVLLNG